VIITITIPFLKKKERGRGGHDHIFLRKKNIYKRKEGVVIITTLLFLKEEIKEGVVMIMTLPFFQEKIKEGVVMIIGDVMIIHTLLSSQREDKGRVWS